VPWFDRKKQRIDAGGFYVRPHLFIDVKELDASAGLRARSYRRSTDLSDFATGLGMAIRTRGAVKIDIDRPSISGIAIQSLGNT
jgi:hypothetical protein